MKNKMTTNRPGFPGPLKSISMIMKSSLLSVIVTLAAALGAAAQGVTSIPASYALPAGSVDTNKPGFRVRPYQTAAAQPNTLAWTEDQLAGLHGPNLADLSGGDTNGYYTVTTVVNWNIVAGNTVDTFPPADNFPGIGANGTTYFSEEILTYIEFPAAGTYTMGVSSDDGFRVAVSSLTPKDRFSAITLGQFDGGRGAADTTFQFSVPQAGIYPFRTIYEQGGGDASVDWFSVITNSTSTNFVLINDTSTPGALKAYSSAKIGPPYAGAFVHNPAGFILTINDDVSALVASTVQAKLNGTNITVTTTKTGNATAVSFSPAALFPTGVTNTLTVQFSDNATPPNTGSATLTFVEPPYAAIPAAAALPASAVDTTQRGFLFRVNQIDSGTYGFLAANNAHAEAQLAGQLIDPASGKPYPNTAPAGTQPDGSYIVNGVLNFSFDLTAEQGAFSTANGHPDTAFPGVTGANSDNLAGEIVGYLDLKPGFYQFAVNATDGFRLTAGANPYDVLGGVTLGLFDFRAISTETQFGVAVQTAGIYPVRLVWYRVTQIADNSGDASLEFYTINSDGSKVLVNDSTNSTAVKAYWKRTAGYAPYVKYVGPSSFVSPFGDSADVGFTNVTTIISDGSSNKVDASSVALSVDGVAVNAAATSANGLTTLSYAPTGLQLPRVTHTASLAYAEAGQGGAKHSNNWNFHLLRNYILPAPLYFEDFESTAAGPDPSVPTGWVQQNFTGHQDAGNDPTDLNSDFYLGWVVVDKSFNISKDTGVSRYSPQVLNGVAFDENTNPLLVNHYMRAETDSRQNGPPGQIQYVTTKPYDLTGKVGVVIAFNSSYEQNQDNINALEYSVDNGTNWNPVFYWVMGDFDSQGPADTLRDGLGNIDAVKTLTTTYGDVAEYTDPTSGQLVGGYYGFFIKAPITQALAPYIEGRLNDDNSESKRLEVYRVPLADNQKSVMFRFAQAGTSSWYWAIDNWGVYSVPSMAAPPATTGTALTVTLNGSTLNFSWTGGNGPFQLQKATSLPAGNSWQNVGSATSSTSATDTISGGSAFYRVVSQ
jgi:hypothetical protein